MAPRSWALWGTKQQPRAFLWLLLFLALPLSQARGQASRVRGSCLSGGAPILHHHTLPDGAGAAMLDRVEPSCKIMPGLEHRPSWPPTVYWALFHMCSGW